VYTNTVLVTKACQLIIDKLLNCISAITDGQNSIVPSKTTIRNAFDVRLEEEDYTLGHLVENVLNKRYYTGQEKLSYVGFKKFHPHDSHSILRLALVDPEANVDTLKEYIISACTEVVKLYEKIIKEFPSSG
jgi:DNA-directed RNA polymerase subunit L